MIAKIKAWIVHRVAKFLVKDMTLHPLLCRCGATA